MWSKLHWLVKIAIVLAVLVGGFFLLIPIFEWMEQFLDTGGAVGYLG